MKTLTTIVAATIVAATAVITPATAKADPVSDKGCVEQFWMWQGLRPAIRRICDSYRNPDGSWERARGFFANAYTTNGYSSCSRYSCVYSPPRYVPELAVVDRYIVTDATVLPDEPGWIPDHPTTT